MSATMTIVAESSRDTPSFPCERACMVSRTHGVTQMHWTALCIAFRVRLIADPFVEPFALPPTVLSGDNPARWCTLPFQSASLERRDGTHTPPSERWTLPRPE